ncbi:MAG: SRPBCC family protein [Nocardioidaceae bacterium]
MSDKRISAQAIIEAPPAVVFAIIADPRQHSRIDGSGSVQDLASGPQQLDRGATFDVRMRLFGVPYTISNRVVEFEQDKQIAWRHFGGHRWRYELEPSGAGGTRVTETFDYSRYGTVASGVIRGAGFPERNRRGIEATLVRLKAAAEQDAAASQ